MKKWLYQKMKPTFKKLNEEMEKQIRNEVSSSIESSVLDPYVEKQKTCLNLPRDEIVQEKDSTDVVSFYLKKGKNLEYSQLFEQIVTQYISGHEILVREEDSKVMFGQEGQQFINELKQKSETLHISRMERKRIWVVNEIFNEMENVKEEIKKFIKRMKKGSDLIFRYNLKVDEVNFLQDFDEEQTAKRNLDILKETLISHQQNKIKEVELCHDIRNHQLIVRFTDDKIPVIKKYVGTKLREMMDNYNNSLLQLDQSIILDNSGEDMTMIYDEISLIKDMECNQDLSQQKKDFFCNECLESIDIIHLIECMHSICEQCLHNIVVSSIDREQEQLEFGVPNVRCPQEGCEAPINPSDCMRVVSEVQISRMINERLEKLIVESKELGKCANGKCKALLRIDEGLQGEGSQLTCSSCKTDLVVKDGSLEMETAVRS